MSLRREGWRGPLAYPVRPPFVFERTTTDLSLSVWHFLGPRGRNSYDKWRRASVRFWEMDFFWIFNLTLTGKTCGFVLVIEVYVFVTRDFQVHCKTLASWHYGSKKTEYRRWTKLDQVQYWKWRWNGSETILSLPTIEFHYFKAPTQPLIHIWMWAAAWKLARDRSYPRPSRTTAYKQRERKSRPDRPTVVLKLHFSSPHSVAKHSSYKHRSDRLFVKDFFRGESL